MKNGKLSDKFRKQNLAAVYMCVAGTVLNLVLSSVTAALRLPLYLDTVGTVIVSAMGGYLPGVVVGFATNILKTISDPLSLYYGVLNVLIAVVSAFIADRGWHRKVQGVIGMIISFTFIGGGLGALIPWFMEELSSDSESLSIILNETGIFGPGISHFLASLIMDLPDKVIVVLLASYRLTRDLNLTL